MKLKNWLFTTFIGLALLSFTASVVPQVTSFKVFDDGVFISRLLELNCIGDLTCTENLGTGKIDMSATGGGAPDSAQYVTLALDATLSAERVLTGTANQVILTDGGANTTITLSTPQDIHTGASPTFVALSLNADTNQIVLDADEGSGFTGTITIDSLAAARAYTFPDASGEISLLGQLIDLTSEVTGTLPVGSGGMGATSHTDGAILLGSGASAISNLGVLADDTLVLGDGVTAPGTATVPDCDATDDALNYDVTTNAFSCQAIDTGAPSTAQFVTLALDATLSAERVLTGTTDQIIITDGGANTTVTLSTPQDIATTSSPTFANMNISDDIIHTGDTNNFISFGTDTMDFVSNNISQLEIDGTGIDPQGVIINQSGVVGVDFRVETDIFTNALRIDAGTNTVAFFTTPASTFIMQMAGSHDATISGRPNAFNFDPSITLDVDDSAVIFSVDGTLIEAASGTHVNLDGSLFTAPTITVGAAAVTNASTVRISGAPSASGAINNALLVQGTSSLRNIIFDTDSTYDIGTVTVRAKEIFTDAITITGASLGLSADGSAADTFLTRDAADILALNDTATPAVQEFRIYNADFVDASNYERLAISMEATQSQILLESAGSGGATNTLRIGTVGTGQLQLLTNNTSRWAITSSGDLLPTGNNTLDFGSTGFGLRNVYIENQLLLNAATNQIVLDADEGSGFTGTITLDSLTAARTYTFPDATGTVMLAASTLNSVVKFGANSTGVDSAITDTGSLVTIGDDLDLGALAADSISFIGIVDSDVLFDGTATRTIFMDDGADDINGFTLSIIGSLAGPCVACEEGAGLGGGIFIISGQGGAGTGAKAAGGGGTILIESGDAGTDNGGGGSSAGTITMRTGDPTGSGSDGNINIGNFNRINFITGDLQHWRIESDGDFVVTNASNEFNAVALRPTSGFFDTVVADTLGLSAVNSAADAFLVRDAADIIAQRNGTTAQEFRLYETFTDASNYERIEIQSASNVATIHTDSAGTGSTLSMVLGTVDAGNLTFKTSDTSRWLVNSTTGDLTPFANNTYDLGSTSLAPTDIHVANQVIHAGDIDTHIQFTNNLMLFRAMGARMIEMNGNSTPRTIELNPDSGNTDISIDTDNVADALFFDASEDIATFGVPQGYGNTVVALGAAAVTFSADTNHITVTGDAGTNTIATITSGTIGEIATFLFVDALVTITDNNAHDADSVDLDTAFTSADDVVLTLLFDGTSWYEITRSTGSGAGAITGSGTTNTIPKFTASTILGDSSISDTGSLISLLDDITLGSNSADSLTLTASLISNITFQATTTRTIGRQTAAVDTNAARLEMVGGQGGAASAGVGGTGSSTRVTGGAGGAGDGTFAGGFGGSVIIAAGAGGSDGGAGGNFGGNLVLQAGNATGASTDGSITLGDTTTQTIVLGSGGTSNRWTLNSSGFIIPGADSTYDIGTTTVRVREIFTDAITITGASLGLSADGSAADVILARDAADILAMRNSTADQSFHMYKTFTDASNYERLEILTAGTFTSPTIRTAQAGTGSSRTLSLETTGTGSLFFTTNSTTRWTINGTTGDIVLGADSIYDIGNQTARPAEIWVDDLFAEQVGLSFAGSVADIFLQRAFAGGLAIDQDAFDVVILSLRSTDVAHSCTTCSVGTLDLKTGDYFGMGKRFDAAGGIEMIAISETAANHAYQVYAIAGSPLTTDTGFGTANWHVIRHDGADARVDFAANANAFSFRQVNAAGTATTAMLIKVDGRLFNGGLMPFAASTHDIGTTSLAYNVIYVAARLEHAADTDTFIAFTSNVIDFDAGGIELMSLDHSTIDPTGIIFNTTQDIDMDLTWKSDNVANAFFLDAGAERATFNIPQGHGNTAVALAAAATTFAADTNFVTVTGDAGTNTIATITSGVFGTTGQRVTLLFVDALVTITDDNTHGADSVDLSAAFTSVDDTTLELIYDGTSWYEVSRSVN